MTTTFILLTALVFYLLGLFLAYKTGVSWIGYGAALLWFVPITLYDNVWLITFSVIMLIATVFFTYNAQRRETYD